MKNYLGLMLIGSLLAAMAGIFWHIQLKYYLPTPVPEGYRLLRAAFTYNQARYCNLPDRQFVAQALVALLAQEPPPNLGPVATRAYGCELPGKTDQTSLFPFL